MICKMCLSQNIRALIHVQMYIDAKYNYHLTKRVISDKSTTIVSQSHDKTSYVCSDCGYFWGFGYDDNEK